MVRIENYNWQTRLVQFKDQKKKLKTYLIARIELSLNENTNALSLWTCLKYAL